MAIPIFPANAIPDRANAIYKELSANFLLHIEHQLVPALNAFAYPLGDTMAEPELIDASPIVFEASDYTAGQVKWYLSQTAFTLNIVHTQETTTDIDSLKRWYNGEVITVAATSIEMEANEILKVWVSGAGAGGKAIMNFDGAQAGDSGGGGGGGGTGAFPVVTLLGLNPDEIVEGDGAYVDPGATATDAEDGALVPVVTGTVDDNVAGTYILTYTATDTDGNATSEDRTVEVLELI